MRSYWWRGCWQRWRKPSNGGRLRADLRLLAHAGANAPPLVTRGESKLTQANCRESTRSFSELRLMKGSLRFAWWNFFTDFSIRLYRAGAPFQLVNLVGRVASI